jgi:predicted alpha/beta hydrolase family esterase
LPGWFGSGPQHWQTRWEQLYGDRRVEQHDWAHPLRGDWQIQLEEAVLQSAGPVVLVAHSLGAHLVASWAAHSRLTDRVLTAWLVAPPDLGQDLYRGQLGSWYPVHTQRLPFPAQVVASRNDRYCDFAVAAVLAKEWGASLIDAGQAGHLNAESALGDWPRGREWLNTWIQTAMAMRTRLG